MAKDCKFCAVSCIVSKKNQLPPISLIRDFSNQNACGNVSIKILSQSYIAYHIIEIFHFTASEIQNMELQLLEVKVKSFFEFKLASGLFVCACIQDYGCCYTLSCGKLL